MKDREALIPAIADAIGRADDSFGYSYRMTSLVDGVETHTLFMDGYEPVAFEDREDGYGLIQERRNAVRADAVLDALSAAPDREAIARPSDDDLDAHLPERLKAAKRCGIQRSAWLDGWFVGWSPRNDNENAEGPWSDWLALAHAIIAADEAAILATAAVHE
jgi:hypothetical protein